MNKLKPCPCCGGEAVIKDMGSKRFHIACKFCPLRLGDVWDDKESIIFLTEKWNNRII